MSTVRVGLVQLRSSTDPAENLVAAEKAIREAAAQGAQLIVTPEATNILQRDDEALVKAVVPGKDDPAVPRLTALANELKVWLLVGSLMVKAEDGRVANRSHVFTPDGGVAATYDKIHLFDVQLGSGEAYKESKRVRPGESAVVVKTPWGGLGLTVCYDLRFAHLYRALAKAGAKMIAVPAAFTKPTGEAHWEVLLRARAIETGSFVLAAGQGGKHADGRTTWGHSTVVGPWGEIVGKLDHDEPGVLIVDLDLAQVDVARGKIPALTHDREFSAPKKTGP
jgi:predicted amidohydrolase